MSLRAPFPWFGGKSRAAHLVWPRFGNAPNYIEPFAGSLAILLNRPEEWPPRVETVNDVDAYLCNFWRAVRWDPWLVAEYADWPVNETDLHARHRWLVTVGRERLARMKYDPEYFDAQVAGWWVYGLCLWIGSGWCAAPEWTGRTNAGRAARGINTDQYQQRPDLSSAAGRGMTTGADTANQARRPELMDNKGIHKLRTRNGDTSEQERRPQLTNDAGINTIGVGNWQKRPEMKRGGGRGVHARGIAGDVVEKRPMGTGNGQGCGVHKVSLHEKMPQFDRGGRGIAGESIRRPNMGGRGGGQGVQSPTLIREQIPQLSGDGSGSQRGILSDGIASAGLFEYLHTLAKRLRRVRVCCGDWTRVVTPAVTTYIGVTGIFLDPPYDHDLRSICYSHDNNVSGAVREWALANGDNPKLRIALCGYADEHDMPRTWECVPWQAGGGYGRSERGVENRTKERIWFSPHCLKPDSGLFPLFEDPTDAERDDDRSALGGTGVSGPGEDHPAPA